MIRFFRQSARVATAGIFLATLALAMGQAGSARADLVLRNVNVTLNATAIQSYGLDVDLNGSVDFTFTAAYSPDPTFPIGFDTVDVPRSNSFDNALVVDRRVGDGFPTASLLAPGQIVSSTSLFSSTFDQSNLYYNISSITGDAPTGHFEGRTGFIGFRFNRGTDVLYGFAQITINSFNDPVNPLNLRIGLVGYNSTPGQAVTIPVPEPTSLALSALGGLSLLAFARLRRRS